MPMLISSSFALFLLLPFITLTFLCHCTFANGDNQMRAVVMAPHNSSTKSHFNLTSRLAIVLAEQNFVKNVHILILVYKHEENVHWPSKEKLAKLTKNVEHKLTFELYEIDYERIKALPNFGMDTRAGCQMEEKAKPGKTCADTDVKAEEGEEDQIEEIEPEDEGKGKKLLEMKKWPVVNAELSKHTIYENEQLIFEVMAEDVEFIEKLQKKGFNVGMAEHFHLGAFAIFPLIGANSAVISRISTLNGVWLDYADVMDQAIELKLPERKALWLDGDKAVSKDRNYAKDYKATVDTNNELIKKAEDAFRGIYNYKKYGKEFIGFRKLFSQTEFQFANWQLGMDFPQMEELHKNMPKLVYVGGICMPKDLGQPDEQTLKWLADGRQIVPVSFGSILETEEMPVKYFAKFVETFGKFENILFVWNFKFGPKGKDAKHGVKVPDNVHLVKWMQLPLILKNQKTRLFISHCGGGSAGESISAGVPLICLPISAGQPYNARAMASRGLAKVIGKIGDILEQNNLLENSIREMLEWKNDSKFKMALEKVQKEMELSETNFIKSMRKVQKNVADEKKGKAIAIQHPRGGQHKLD